jgi:HSP20 family protein
MSFLEKLQKGMQNEDPATGPAENEAADNGIAVDSAQLQPTENNAAVFASYKAVRNQTDPEERIPLPEELPVRKTRPRGRPRKLITAENVDEMPDSPTEFPVSSAAPETKDNFKRPLPKTMANKKNPSGGNQNESSWLNGDGQLAVNVYQTDSDLVLQTAVAGVKAEELDVIIEDEIITIKGNRPNPLQESGDYFIEECYWGPFSRKIILPVEVDSSRADAAMKEGVLTIRIPKIQREKKKKIMVKE